jgi:RNA polymerase sigma-70 factor (ECF subfamily)
MVHAKPAPMAKPDPRKREEFAKWALPHMDQVYTASLYLTHNKEDAEELLQETFLRAYRFWHQFAPGTNCKAWLLTILHNNFRNRYREGYRERQAVEFDESAAEHGDAAGDRALTDPEEVVFSSLLDGEVEQALRGLPVEFLEAVLLVDIQELSYEEAATALGCPIGTIRSRLSRGRRLLQRSLQQYAREHGYLRRG